MLLLLRLGRWIGQTARIMLAVAGAVMILDA
jgi:hypothetical protein